MTLTLAMSLLPIGNSDPEIAPHDASSWDVEAYEDLFCWQCGELENFWVDYTIDHSSQLSPDDNQEVEGTYTPPGMHGRMTMCLNCGSFNSDLFPDDVRFGTNLFRLEPCTLHGCLEIFYQ